MLIVQYDTTQQTEHEMYVHEFTESQLGMLSEIYPRYVIEDFARERPADLDELALTARHHPHATLLFAGKKTPACLILCMYMQIFGCKDL